MAHSASLKISIRAGDVEVSEELRAHAQKRLDLALGRFSERISRVGVRFYKDESAGANVCEISVTLEPQGAKAAVADADLYAAVDHAANRVARSIARLLEREK